MSKTQKFNLIAESEMAAAIKSIKTNGAKLDHAIHVAAVSAVAIASKEGHPASTGNIFYVNSLYAAMPKGARHAALTAWLTTFGGLMANEGENKDTTPFVHDSNKALDMEGGLATPWYSMKQSPKPDQVLDVLKLTLAVIAKAKKPKEGQEVAHAAMIEKLEALAEEFAPAEEVADSTDPK
jgi:hypothetical protein